MEKVPYMLIVGDREEANAKVAVRTREGMDLGQISLEKILNIIAKKIADKVID